MLSRALTATLASPIIMPAIAASLTRIPQLINRSLLSRRSFSATPSQPDEKKLLTSKEKDVKLPTHTKTTNSSTSLIQNQTIVTNFMRTPFLETKPKETHINNLLIKKSELPNPNHVLISEDKLQPGYQALHNSVNGLIDQAIQAAIITPALSGAWLFVISPLVSDALSLTTPASLLESPVAMATLAIGGLFIAKNMMEVKRVNEYTRLSAITHPVGPSISEDDNLKVRQIVAGEKPKIKFNVLGLKISGPLGNLSSPSSVLQDTITEIHNKRRVVIPACTLRSTADKLVNLTTERWLSRTTVPLSILNLIAIASKDPKDRRLDDYVVMAAAAENLFDYFSGPSVGEARERFTRLLKNCRNVDAVLKVLIDHHIIDNGGMSFLKEWAKDLDSVGLRVGRDGSAILYKHRKFSLGGPYPIKTFPERDENEEPATFKPK